MNANLKAFWGKASVWQVVWGADGIAGFRFGRVVIFEPQHLVFPKARAELHRQGRDGTPARRPLASR